MLSLNNLQGLVATLAVKFKLTRQKDMCTIDGYNYKTSIPIRFADIDAFGHVNNATYLTYFEIARSVYWKEIIRWDWNAVGIIIRKSEIEYLKPILMQDEIYAYVRTCRIGDSSFDIEYVLVKKVNGKEEICTTGQTSCVAYDYNLSKSVPIPAYQKNKMRDFEAISVRSPEFQV